MTALLLSYNILIRRLLTASLLLFSAAPAAHPHSFIALQAQPVIDDGKLTGIAMRWKMDDITSADLLYDAGTAAPGSEVWKKLAAEVMANVLGQHYFSEMWHRGQRVKFDTVPPRYGLAREGHQAVLSFVLPLAKPLPLSGLSLTLMTFDPTYFVDMHYDNAAAFSLGDAAAVRCRSRVDTPTPGAALKQYALSLDKADAPAEEMDLGRQFAQTVTLTCP
ncbi:DUF1007 family protein [Pantoea sp. 1.19]|uniref:DUF1007 family protein n=1 Tax=Pantoea sp. 1.19 TaxID=1925589 RepID=UPI000948D3B8|nr:DUF1007 family protein [Pantoea sp. 1.19]